MSNANTNLNFRIKFHVCKTYIGRVLPTFVPENVKSIPGNFSVYFPHILKYK